MPPPTKLIAGVLPASNRRAIEMSSSGRWTNEVTTTAPAVAPIVAETKAIFAACMKLCAGTKYPHSE